jgi:AcrR family transcriptional regulator
MKAQDTKTRLLQVGVDQLSSAGLSGVTLGQLATAAGLSKSGLFAHFKSKDQLQIDLLDEAARLSDHEVLAPITKAAAGLPRLQALVDLWLGWSSRAGLSGGCPLAAALFELDDQSGEVRDHVTRLEAQWRGVLTAHVQDAIAAGHLNPDTDIAQVVWEIQAIYLGHHASSRFLRDPMARSRAITAFDALIDRLVRNE